MINETLLENYKKHPRVLEVRFILLFNIVEREYGYQQTMKFYTSICNAFNCNMNLLQGVINKRFEIQRNSKRNYTRWRQEVIFSSRCYGETIYKVANDYLGIKPSTIYVRPDIYDIDRFCNDEWLEELDNACTLCGTTAYRVEVLRFFEVIDGMTNVFVKWKGDK